MQTPSFPLLQFRSKELADQPLQRSSGVSFFDAYRIAGLARSLFLSSLLWVFLAFAVYMVYTLIASR
jgi:hypothetical protein